MFKDSRATVLYVLWYKSTSTRLWLMCMAHIFAWFRGSRVLYILEAPTHSSCHIKRAKWVVVRGWPGVPLPSHCTPVACC